MPHRLLAAYPEVKELLFVDFRTLISHGIDEELGQEGLTPGTLFFRLSTFYKEQAEDRDIRLLDGNQQPVEDLQEAQTLEMNSGMVTPKGEAIWYIARRNSQQDRSLFFSTRFVTRPRETVEESAPAEKAVPVEESAPAEEAVPVEESAPAEEAVPVEESAPAEEPAPVEESAPAEEPAQAEEAAPAEETAHTPAAVPSLQQQIYRRCRELTSLVYLPPHILARIGVLANFPQNTNVLQQLSVRYDRRELGANPFVITDNMGTPVERLEDAASLRMSIGLTAPNRKPIWIYAFRNARPGSLFFTTSVYIPRPDGHFLLRLFPVLESLAFFNYQYLRSELSMCMFDGTTTDQQILEQINDGYQALRDEDIVCLKNGEPCPPEDADTIRLPIGLTDAAKNPVIMVLEQNATPDRQPWKKKKFDIRMAHMAHRFREQYPLFAAMGPGALVFVTDEMRTAFNTAMRRRVDNVINANIMDFVGTMEQVYQCATDEDIILLDRDQQRVETIQEAAYCKILTPYKNGRARVAVLLNRNMRAGAPFTRPMAALADEIFPGTPPKEYLNRWADINLEEILPRIAEMAVPEDWQFSGGRPWDILRSYVRYTAYRQINHSAFLMDGSKTVCVVNLGLLSRSNEEDICLVFSRRDPTQKWAFRDIATVDQISRFTTSGFGGKQPTPPSYCESTGELVFPLQFRKTPEEQCPRFNETHVITERLHRLPKDMLSNIAESLADVQRADEFVALIMKPDFGPQLQTEWRRAQQLLQETEGLLVAIRDRIRAVMIKAIKRQRVNYKTIIPSYYPQSDELCFLMPLRLSNRHPETNPAMVLRDAGSGWEGATILSMDMVYKNSRLICKPESDWIHFEQIRDTNEDA